MPKGTYDLIETRTVSGSSTTSLVFSNIPQNFTDLQIVMTTKINDINPYYVFNRLRLNGDTGGNYGQVTAHNFYGNFVPQGGPDPNADSIYIDSSFGSSTSYTTSIVDILNYSSTTTFKGFIARAGGSGPAPYIYGLRQGNWRNTNAVTSITIDTNGSWILTAGSYYAIYGIRSE